MRLFLSSSREDRSCAKRWGATMRALGAEVISDATLVRAGAALEASDGFVLILPEPGTPRANHAFFEAGAARARGKRIVAVMPNADAARARELPNDM